MNYGNVIIVGNGGCLLNSKLGKKIDSYDYIVRMGEFRIKGYEKDVGTRTDMYRMKWFNVFDCENNTNINDYGNKRQLDFSFNDIMFTFQDPDEYIELALNGKLLWHRNFDDLHKFNFSNTRIIHDKLCRVFNFNKCRNVHFFSSYLQEKLKMELGLKASSSFTFHDPVPSAGICTIYYFLEKMQYNTLTIVGFDGFASGHYWKPEVKFSCYSHYPINEKIYITKLLKEKKIYELR